MYQDVQFDFHGKVVIVTGVSSGIGRSCAECFDKAGAHVVLIARRRERIQALEADIRAQGGSAMALPCDIADETATLAAAKRVYDAYGRIDALVNVAGTTSRSLPGDSMEENWDQCMNINLRGTWLMCRAVLPYMEQQGKGRIVNVSSVNALRCFKDVPIQPYYASKEGVLGLTKGIAAYYGKKGITCNAVLPGLFKTEMTAGAFWDSIVEDTVRHTPMDRTGEVEEMNGAILFFASELSGFVTGQWLAVDGGYSICM